MEMPVDYGAEALKAQAVAARTYAASRYNGSYVDVTDSTSTQVYYGYKSEKPQGNQAVDATRGVIATYNGSVISALYSACCGGRTENNENVYTQGAPVAYLRGIRCYLDGSYADLSSDAAAAAFWASSPAPASHCDWSASLYRWPPIYWSRSDLQAIIDRYLPDVPLKYQDQQHPYSRGALGTLHELQAVERGVSGKIRRLRICYTSGSAWEVLSDCGRRGGGGAGCRDGQG
jgi:peptidoglycan hydrolase-like amidase